MTLLIILVGILFLILITLGVFFLALRSHNATVSISRIGALLAWSCLFAARSCKQGCVKLLNWGTHRTQTPEDTHTYTVLVGDAILRLLFLVTSIALLLGEVPYSTLRYGWFFAILTGGLKLPLGLLAFLQGLVGILIPGVWFFLLIEAVGLLSQGACLFPILHEPRLYWRVVRVFVGLIAASFLVASLVVSFFINASAQCQLHGLSCATDPTIQVNTGGTFGVLQVSTSLLCILGIALGLTVICSIVLGIVSLLLFIAALGFGLMGDALATLSNPEEAKPLPIPVLFAKPTNIASTAALIGPHARTLLLPSGSRGAINPEEDPMLEKNTTLLFFGPFGYRFIFPLVEAMRREFALGCVLVGGGFDLSRPHTTKPHPFSGDIEVVCPEPQEIAYALSDESPEAAYQRLATMMVERAISVHTQNKKQVQGQIIILVDMYIAPYLSSQIRELKTRLPRQTIVCVTELPELAHRDERVDEAYVVFAALHKERDDKNERIVETTLVLDSHAAVATAVGIEQQDRLAGKSHACGVIGHLHSMHNPTFAEAARRLGNHTAFSGLSVATAHVATGNSPKLVKLVEWLNPKASKRGFGDVQDMVTQIRTTTRRVFDNTSNPSTKASEGTIDTSKPSIAIVTAPMKAKDPRYAEEVSGAIRSFYKQTYPRSSLILVPGGGTVDKKLGNGFFTQVACWYPFDPVGLSASPAQSQATRERLTLVPVESESASNTVNGSPQRIASSS